MDQFTPEQLDAILKIVGGTVAVFSMVAGVIARSWSQKQTTRQDEAERKAKLAVDEARAKAQVAADDAAKAKVDADSMNKLVDVLSQSQRARDRKDDAFLTELKGIGESISSLKTVDTQRIEQASITAAQATGAREDIRQLSADFVRGKDDAVAKVGEAMDDKLRPIQQRLDVIERLLHEVRELVQQQEAQPAPHIVEKADEEQSA